MIEFIAHNMAPISFVVVMAMLLLGYPVAFTLAAGGLFFFAFGLWLADASPSIRLFPMLLTIHVERTFGVLASAALSEILAATAASIWALLAMRRRPTAGALFLFSLVFGLAAALLLLSPSPVLVSLAGLGFALWKRALPAALEVVAGFLCAMLMVLVGARVFGLTFYGLEGSAWLGSFLSWPLTWTGITAIAAINLVLTFDAARRTIAPRAVFAKPPGADR